MNSGTSFFNKTIFKCDMKRLWWSSALAAVAMFLSTALPFINYIDGRTDLLENGNEEFAARVSLKFASLYSFTFAWGIITAIALSALLFNYMNKANSVSCIHGLPLTRRTLYFTHLISGAVLLIIPALVNLPFFFSAVSHGMSAKIIGQYFLVYLVYSLAALCVTTFVGMMTGNAAAQMIFTLIFSLLPLLIVAFYEVVCENHLYGYYSSDRVFKALLEYVYLSPEYILSYRAVFYIILIAVMTLLGLFAYNRRGLENHGEILAFSWTKGIFKVGFAVCAGILGYFYSYGMWNITNLLIMLPYALVGLVIAHMLVNKSLSLKGITAPAVSTAAAILIVFAAASIDITGFEKRVPELDDIQSVRFCDQSAMESYFVYIDSGRREYRYKEVVQPIYDTAEEIKLFRNLHLEKVDNRASDQYNNLTGYYVNRTVEFEYTLKNGRKMYRSYLLNNDEIKEYLAPIYETDTYRAFQNPLLDGTHKDIVTVSVYDSRLKPGVGSMIIDGRTVNAEKITEAIIADRKDLSFDEQIDRKSRSSLTTVEITYTKPSVDEFGFDVESDYSECLSYDISPDDVNTLAVLEEIGFFDDSKLYGEQGLQKAQVYVTQYFKNGNYFDIGEAAYAWEEESGGNMEIVTESADALAESKYAISSSDLHAAFASEEQTAELYEFATQYHKFPMFADDVVHLDLVFTYADGEFGCSVWAEVSELPDFLKDALFGTI